MMVMVMMMVPKMKSSFGKRWGEIRGKWEQVISLYQEDVDVDVDGDGDDGDDHDYDDDESCDIANKFLDDRK